MALLIETLDINPFTSKSLPNCTDLEKESQTSYLLPLSELPTFGNYLFPNLKLHNIYHFYFLSITQNVSLISLYYIIIINLLLVTRWIIDNV